MAIERLRAAVVARPLRPAIVFAIAAAAHAFVAAAGGVIAAPDTKAYVEWAGIVSGGGFTPTAYADAQSVGMRSAYAGFVTLVAVLKLLVGARWTIALVALNVVAAGLTAVMIADLIAAATRSRVAQAAAIVFTLLCFDLVNYTRFLLKDTTYVCLSCAVFYFVARPIAAGVRDPVRSWMAALAAGLCALTWRPSASTLLVVPAAAAIAWRLDGESRRAVTRRRVVAYLTLVATAALIVVHAAFMRAPGAWPAILPGGDWIEALGDDYRHGIVMEIRTLPSAPGESLEGYAALTVQKLVLFLTFAHPDFSAAHNFAAILYYVPLYGLAVFGLVGPGPRYVRDPHALRTVAWTAAACVAALSLFHAMTVLDFDWRYRLPAMPPLIVLASFGVFCIRVRR